MDQKHKEGLDILFSKKYKIIIIIIINIIKQKSKITTKWPLSPYNRLRVVPHFSSGIVERAKRERAWKSPHARKGDTRQGQRILHGGTKIWILFSSGKIIFYQRAQRVSKILFLPRENEIHVFKPPCNVLFIM